MTDYDAVIAELAAHIQTARRALADPRTERSILSAGVALDEAFQVLEGRAPQEPSPSERVEQALRLAEQATNGWACYAKRKIEHDDIARLHSAIAALRATPPAAADGRDTPPPRRYGFECPECGFGVGVDEDGCCRTCGSDTTPKTAGEDTPQEPPRLPMDWESILNRLAKSRWRQYHADGYTNLGDAVQLFAVELQREFREASAVPPLDREDYIIQQVVGHWFTQGGKAQFGMIPECRNADEVVSAILWRVRDPHPDAPAPKNHWTDPALPQDQEAT